VAGLGEDWYQEGSLLLVRVVEIETDLPVSLPLVCGAEPLPLVSGDIVKLPLVGGVVVTLPLVGGVKVERDLPSWSVSEIFPITC
jgi:hypothetical protein